MPRTQSEGAGSSTQTAVGGNPRASHPASIADPILPQPRITIPRAAMSLKSMLSPDCRRGTLRRQEGVFKAGRPHGDSACHRGRGATWCQAGVAGGVPRASATRARPDICVRSLPPARDLADLGRLGARLTQLATGGLAPRLARARGQPPFFQRQQVKDQPPETGTASANLTVTRWPSPMTVPDWLPTRTCASGS